jgi:hypothetical protein
MLKREREKIKKKERKQHGNASENGQREIKTVGNILFLSRLTGSLVGI